MSSAIDRSADSYRVVFCLAGSVEPRLRDRSVANILGDKNHFVVRFMGVATEAAQITVRDSGNEELTDPTDAFNFAVAISGDSADGDVQFEVMYDELERTKQLDSLLWDSSGASQGIGYRELISTSGRSLILRTPASTVDSEVNRRSSANGNGTVDFLMRFNISVCAASHRDWYRADSENLRNVPSALVDEVFGNCIDRNEDGADEWESHPAASVRFFGGHLLPGWDLDATRTGDGDNSPKSFLHWAK